MSINQSVLITTRIKLASYFITLTFPLYFAKDTLNHPYIGIRIIRYYHMKFIILFLIKKIRTYCALECVVLDSLISH